MFGEGEGAYDNIDELGFGLMFHSFGYPDETGNNELTSRFWHGVMKNGVIDYPHVSACPVTRHVRKMNAKSFELEHNIHSAEQTERCL